VQTDRQTEWSVCTTSINYGILMLPVADEEPCHPARRVVSTPCFVRDECESIAKKKCTVVLSTRPFFKKQCKIEIITWVSVPGSCLLARVTHRRATSLQGAKRRVTHRYPCVCFHRLSVRGVRVGLSVGLWIMRSWGCPVIVVVVAHSSKNNVKSK